MTLDQDHLRSTTTSRADPSFEKDRLWLNGKEEEIKDGGRTATCIAEMKRLRKELVEDKEPNEPKVPRVSLKFILDTHHIQAVFFLRPHRILQQFPHCRWSRLFRLRLCRPCLLSCPTLYPPCISFQALPHRSPRLRLCMSVSPWWICSMGSRHASHRH